MADPQVNPNALGAPTEGFGQTVTFAFDPRGVTPALDLPHSNPRGVGVQGVSRSQEQDRNLPYKQPAPDKTTELLMKAGQEILAPYIERERNAQFVKGMQQSMQGEAVKDMVAQQPWYSRIFGDTPAIEGARVYEVASKANKVVADATANMDKLKTLDPDAASKHFSDLIDGQMTGDPSSDALMSKTLMEHMPVLMKAQAKAYHGYVQKTAADAMSNNMATAGGALQQAGQLFAEDTISEQDMNVRKKQFVNSILPPDGINEETYGKTLAANIRRFAEAGQFHAVAAIKESGGFDALTPEQQNAVNASVDGAAKKYRDQYAFKYAKEIAELRSDAAHLPAGMTPNDIHKRYEQMNTAYQRLTGSPVGLFSSDEVANGLSGTLNYLKSEEAAAARHQATLDSKTAKDQEKLVAKMELDASVKRLLVAGDVFLAGTVTKAKKDDIDVAAYQLFTDKDNPQQGTDLLRNNFVRGGYVNPILKEQMQGLVRTAEGRDAPTNEFLAAVSKYQTLSAGAGGATLAAGYFGDYAPKLERFIRMTGGDINNPNIAQAFSAAMDDTGTQKPEPLPHKEAVALAKEVSKKLDPAMPKWLGGLHLRDETAESVAQLSAKAIEDWRAVPGITDSEAVQRGIASTVASNRIELIGGFAVNRSRTNSTKTLREAASEGGTQVPSDRVDDYFKSFLGTKQVGSAGRVNIVYGGPRNGTDYFSFTYQEPNGQTKLGMFTGAEWAKYAAEQTKADTGPNRRPKLFNTLPLTYGPALTSDPNFNPYDKATQAAIQRAIEARKVKQKP